MSDQGTAPAPAEQWKPPTSDQEFEFTDAASVPSWADKNWASYSQGPALAVPMGDLYGEGPYTTEYARPGDTVRFVAATPSRVAHFEIIRGEPTGDAATKKPPQASAASLEDMIKSGVMTPDDLGPDAKGQVALRSPRLRSIIEGEEGAPVPEPIAVGDLVKVA